MRRSNPAALWDAVDRSGGPHACWPLATTQGAARRAWVLANGAIPKDETGRTLHVCHRCDNPLCCNPEHLFLGTARDNLQDMVQKGRYRGGPNWRPDMTAKPTALSLALRQQRGEAPLRPAARALGISHVTLLQLERGQRKPGLELALRLARWLGWSAEQVLAASSTFTPLTTPAHSS